MRVPNLHAAFKRHLIKVRNFLRKIVEGLRHDQISRNLKEQ